MKGSERPRDRAAAAAPRTGRPRRRAWRWGLGSVVVLAVLLTAARLALPGYLRSYVNRVIDRSPDYDGRVGEIEVHLWRGAYTINDLDIVKTTRSVPVPFFEGERVDFSLYWGALLRGYARGKITMEKPRLNFVHGPSPEETQTGGDQPWLEIIDELFPFRIDRADVIDGRVHFRAFHTSPQVDVYLTEVQGALENLTNIEDKLDPLMATVHATGLAMESGRFEFDMTLDPHSHRPSFNLASRLIGLDVRRLNTLTRAYGDFDFERGRFDLVVEIATRDGFLDGYAKPLFRDLQVISLHDIKDDNAVQVLWEALVGAVGEVFENQPRNQFATRITLEGTLDNPRTSILEIVGNVLRNAFVRAYLPRIEGRTAPDVAMHKHLERQRDETD